MKKKIVAGVLMLVLLSACNRAAPSGPVAIQTELNYLGTVISISLYDEAPASVLEDAFDAVADVHARMSVHEASSEIASLNRDGFLGNASPDTLALIEMGRSVSEASGGAFDITVGVLTGLWDIGGEHPNVPEPAKIVRALGVTGYKHLDADAASATVRFAEQGMAADLGAIAKGYACDEAARILREAGVQHAMLDFGGNIYALGEYPDGSPWRIGLRTPLIGEEAAYMGILSVRDKAVVTSGAYERFFEQDGKTYHHILDPHSGYPADSGLLSVTVVCENSAMADALSTACFVLGTQEGLKLIRSWDGVEGIFITEEKEVFITDGLHTAFSLKDQRFKVVSTP